MIRNANDLTPTERAAVESLLGRRVQDGEAVSDRAFAPAAISLEQRQEIAEELKRYFAEIDADRKPAPDGEQEGAIDEAMRSVRPSYRPLEEGATGGDYHATDT